MGFQYALSMVDIEAVKAGDLLAWVSFDDLYLMGEVTSLGQELASLGVHYRDFLTGEVRKVEYQFASAKVFVVRKSE